MRLIIESDEILAGLDVGVTQLEKAKHEVPARRRGRQESVKKLLIALQDIKDIQMKVVGELTELIEGNCRRLDASFDNIDPSTSNVPPTTGTEARTEASSKSRVAETESRDTQHKSGVRRKRPKENVKEEKVRIQTPDERQAKKQKQQRKRSLKRGKDESPPVPSVASSTGSQASHRLDPDEPVYCLCRQVSYGEMVGCDNGTCPMEWFHFNCVGLSCKPKGKWYCPRCRGDKPNVRRSDWK